MTKKEIRKLAQEKIKAGKTQQESFDEIIELTKISPDMVANIVKTIPTLEMRQKYKVPNAVLVSLLLLTVIFKVIMGISMTIENGVAWSPVILIFPLLNIVMLWGVATYASKSHQSVALLTGLSFINTLGRQTFEPMMFFDVAIAAALIALSLYLQFKLTPGFAVVNEPYTNAQGKVKARTKIKFNDYKSDILK